MYSGETDIFLLGSKIKIYSFNGEVLADVSEKYIGHLKWRREKLINSKIETSYSSEINYQYIERKKAALNYLDSLVKKHSKVSYFQ